MPELLFSSPRHDLYFYRFHHHRAHFQTIVFKGHLFCSNAVEPDHDLTTPQQAALKLPSDVIINNYPAKEKKEI